MLQELRIKNFAIIEELFVSFSDGMTVLTGETGAGKSIIIDAVGLVAGGRGSSTFVRHGEKKCSLEALFTIEVNKEAMQTICIKEGIEFDGKYLDIQREIYDNGRQTIRVNGTQITVGILKNIGSLLVDIHGQNEHQELMQSEHHTKLLDTFGDEKHQKKLNDYQKEYERYRYLKNEYDLFEQDEQEAAQRLDLLRFQIDEIEEAGFILGEEEELEEERLQLRNFQKIMESLSYSYQILSGNEDISTLNLLGEIEGRLQGIEDIHQDYQKLSSMVTDVNYQLKEVSSIIYDYMHELEYDEARLNEIEERLNLLQQFKRKYGVNIEEILSYQDKAEVEYKVLQNRESALQDLEQDLQESAQETLEKGKRLSESRKYFAKELESEIHSQLEELYMEKVVFEVNFGGEIADATILQATRKGLDTIEFYISTNPGEPLKPLSEIASGGELSRMMLALKAIFSKKQGITSIIFDEVDTGVSGRVAQAIAEKIHAVSVNSQVLCISHLPQVAARADYHLYISKHIEDERTKTQVRVLNESEKVEAIALMMSGEEISEATLNNVREMRQRYQ